MEMRADWQALSLSVLRKQYKMWFFFSSPNRRRSSSSLYIRQKKIYAACHWMAGIVTGWCVQCQCKPKGAGDTFWPLHPNCCLFDTRERIWCISVGNTACKVQFSWTRMNELSTDTLPSPLCGARSQTLHTHTHTSFSCLAESVSLVFCCAPFLHNITPVVHKKKNNIEHISGTFPPANCMCRVDG